MKAKMLVTLFLTFIISIGNSQPPPVQWIHSQGGTGDDFVNGVIEASDGNYIFSGTSTSNDGDLISFGNNGGRDAWIYKVNRKTGTIMSGWGDNYGGSSNDQLWRVIETSDDGFAAVGFSASNTLPGYHPSTQELYFVKMNSLGKLQWQKCFGGDGSNDWGDNLVQANNGNFIFVGKTNTNNNGDLTSIQYNGGISDLWIAEIDANGAHNIVTGRNKCFGGSLMEDFGSIAKTSDGGYIVSCRTNSTDGMVVGNHGGYDTWVLKLDSALNIQWKKCYGGTQDDIQRNIFQDTDGNYVLAGSTNSTDGDLLSINNFGMNDYWMFKIASGGMHNIIWEKTIGGSQSDFALCGIRAYDGGYLICGRTFSNDHDIDFSWGLGDCWIAKLNASNPAGSLDWVKTTGGTGYDGANWIIQSSDSGIVVAAEGRSDDVDIPMIEFHTPSNPVNEESYTYKLKDKAMVADVSMINDINLLIDIYPNPSKGKFFTDIYCDDGALISIKIMNSLGKMLLSKTLSASPGRNKFYFNEDNLFNGLYLIVFETESQIIKRKILIAK